MSGIPIANNFDVKTNKVLDNRCAGLSSDTNSLTYKPTGLLRYQTDTDNWVYYNGTNFIELVDQNLKDLSDIIYTDGTSVGIGTTSPTEVLDVVGNIKTSNDLLLGGAMSLGTDYGTAGQVLTSQGTNALVWQDAGGGGATELIQSDNIVTPDLNAGANLTTGATKNILLGKNAGSFITTGTDNVVLGKNNYVGGSATQTHNVLIGDSVGTGVTNSNNIAIGKNIGNNSSLGIQGADNIFMGTELGGQLRMQRSIIIGKESGNAGGSVLKSNNIIIGYQAGRQTIHSEIVLIGYGAGAIATTNYGSIGIGGSAGRDNNSGYCVDIGYGAGENRSAGNNHAVSIGFQTGKANTGSNSVSLGSYANLNPSAVRSNCIVINGTGSAFNADKDNALFVKPIRNATASNALFYDATSGEVTYDSASGGGVEGIYSDGSNIGIGTTSPSQKLDVAGTIKGNNLTIGTSLIHTQGGYLGIGTTSPSQKLDVAGRIKGDHLGVGTDLIYTDGPNVGVGTTSPSVKLDVFGDVTTYGKIKVGYSGMGHGCLELYNTVNLGIAIVSKIQGGTVLNGASYTGGGTLRFFTRETVGNLTEKMTILDDGDVGIGTTSPGEKLQVNGNLRLGSSPNNTVDDNNDRYITTAGQLTIRSNDSSNDNGWVNLALEAGKTNPGKIIIGGASSNTTYQNIKFFTSGTAGERMRIDHNGNVGIGTSTPYFPLHVVGQSGGTAIGNRRFFQHSNTSGLIADSAASSVASIYANRDIISGNYFISAKGAAISSDERIKKDISDINDGDALNTLRLLKPKKYSYKDTIQRGSEPVWGFIAQEVRDTLPYATLKKNDFIPNIYELANVSSSNVITFTNFNTSDLESHTNTLIRIIDINDKEHDIHLTEIIDEHSIRVDEDLDEWIGSVDESGNVIQGTQIFVYGEEVHDFHVLKKDAIFTVATAALQEVDRQQQADKARISELETQLASVLTRLEALENA